MTTRFQTEAVTELENKIVSDIEALPDQRTAIVRSIRRDWSRQLSTASAATVLKLARRLMNRSSLYRFFATELIHYHRESFRKVDAREVERLGRGMASWGDVDMFACILSGPAWRSRQIPDNVILRWARSKDFWWRRAALVSTVPLNSKARGGSVDAQRTLRICKMLVNDREDMVVKALSWALRELSKRDPTAVRDFMTEHDKKIAPRIKREVNNKLTTGLKNPRHLAN
jgi:3-methyladenine DNA glycosylase AlkD